VAGKASSCLAREGLVVEKVRSVEEQVREEQVREEQVMEVRSWRLGHGG